MQMGVFHSTKASRAIKVNRSVTAAFRVYGDDAGAVIWGTGSVPDIKGMQSRYLLTKDNTGGHIRAFGLMGQLKGYDAKWNTEQVGAVYGRLELVRSSSTMTLGGYGISASGAFTVATSGAITVNTNHVLAGVLALADFRATLTQTGKTAAFVAAKYDTTNWSDATARTTWGYGIYMPAGSVGLVGLFGASGSPIVNSTASANFIEGNFSSAATSGWGAGMYLTYNMSGIAGNATAIEGDMAVSAAAGDVTGVECFMSFASGGKVTGHAAAGQYTVDFASAALAFSGGAYMAGRFNIKGEGAACDPSGAIRISCIELQNQGTFASGKEFETHAAGYAMYFNGFTAASGVTNILSSTSLAELPTGTLGIRVGVGADGAAGTAYYIPLVLATEWN
jgi:hypothetical protein